MQKLDNLLHSIGKLVRGVRSLTMGQQELAVRSGVGRNTVSNIENGKSVSGLSLLLVLEQLELIDEFQVFVDEKISEHDTKLRRKSRKYQELDNEF
jgi:transcriptional regulator with XRE-family HTH domain